MIQYILYFLVLMNPFALFIYLLPLRRELETREYGRVVAQASLISFGVYALAAIFGNAIFEKFLQLDFEAFRIFGGIVLVAFALSFIVQGKKSMITTRGELSDIAAEVSVPFMVGAGTIAVSILMGQELGSVNSVIAIAVVMVLTFVAIMTLAIFRQTLTKPLRHAFDKNLEALLRINGFIVGAFGVDLIVTGITNLIG